MARKKRRPIPPPPNKGQIRAGAENKAKQNSAPKLAALRAEKKAARKDYRQQVGSVKGAAAMLTDALDISRRELRAQGLRGPYLQSTLSELQSRKGDAAAAVPFEQAALKQELQNTLSSLRDQQQTERIGMEADADAIYKRRIARERAQRQKIIKNRRQRRKDRLEASDKDRRGFRNAIFTADALWNRALQMAAEGAPKDASPEIANKYDSAKKLVAGVKAGDEAVIQQFIAKIAEDAEGADEMTARRAVTKKFLPSISLLGRSSSFIRGR